MIPRRLQTCESIQGSNIACAARMLVTCLLTVALMCAWVPAAAFADVRDTDVIGMRTVAESGAVAANTPSISANHAYVVDSDGTVYFQRDPDAASNIASITKIMTAAVALAEGDPASTISVSARAASIGESTAQLKAGDTLTLEDAVIGLMVPSGNDAACAIAENVGVAILEEAVAEDTQLTRADGSVIDPTAEDAAYDAFVAEMNATAERLGCKDTLFTNPHGLDIGEFAVEMHSTAHDVATISDYAMESPLFREIAGNGDSSITVRRGDADVTIDLASTDLLIGNYEGACGIKTGFTEAAGSCFAGACTRDGKTLYAIVLDAPDNDARFIDARALFDWVYASEKEVPLANSQEYVTMEQAGTTSDVPVVAYAAHADWPDRSFPITFKDPEATISVSSIFGNVSQQITLEQTGGSIHTGDVVGRADFYQHNELVGSEELVACEDIEGPNIFESISLGWQTLTGSLTDEDRIKTVICNEMPILVQKA